MENPKGMSELSCATERLRGEERTHVGRNHVRAIRPELDLTGPMTDGPLRRPWCDGEGVPDLLLRCDAIIPHAAHTAHARPHHELSQRCRIRRRAIGNDEEGRARDGGGAVGGEGCPVGTKGGGAVGADLVDERGLGESREGWGGD